MKWMYDNSYDSFFLNIGEFISDRSIAIADITEAVFMVKQDSEDLDANAIVTLTLGSGLTKVPASGSDPDRIQVQFGASDFGTNALQVTNKQNYYIMGVGIKTVSMTKYLEMKLSDNKLEITPDFIHD